MTEAEIEKRIEAERSAVGDYYVGAYAEDLIEVLEEVQRLRAALKEIRALGDGSPHAYDIAVAALEPAE